MTIKVVGVIIMLVLFLIVFAILAQRDNEIDLEIDFEIMEYKKEKTLHNRRKMLMKEHSLNNDNRKDETKFCEGCKNIAALSILERLAVYDHTGKFCGIRSCFHGDECFNELVKLFTTNGGIANG